MYTWNLNRLGIQAFSHGLLTCEGFALLCWKESNFLCCLLILELQNDGDRMITPDFVFCRDESEWWIFLAGLVVCKFLQSRLVNWHVANLEIQDRSLYSNQFDMFWQSWWLLFAHLDRLFSLTLSFFCSGWGKAVLYHMGRRSFSTHFFKIRLHHSHSLTLRAE